MPEEVQVGYQEKCLLRRRGEALAQAAQGVAESPSLKVFKKCGDATLRDMVSEHGGGGLMVEPDDLSSLFQPLRFCDSKGHLWCQGAHPA